MDASLAFMIVLVLFLPHLAAIAWPVIEILHWMKGRANRIHVVTGTLFALRPEGQPPESLDLIVDDNRTTLPLGKNVPRKGITVDEPLPALCRAIVHARSCVGFWVGGRLYYNSQTLAGRANSLIGILLAPVAAICYSGYIMAAVGLIKYAFGLGFLSFTAEFEAEGAGLFLWIALWLCLTALAMWWYLRRSAKLVARVENEFPGLGS